MKLCKQLFIVALFLFAVNHTANAQQVTVTGVVTDAKTNETVPGVNIYVKGTPQQGVSTEVNGDYSINIEKPDNAVLVFSFVGYKDVEVPINNRLVLNVALEPSAESLDEVIVIGYGTQRKRDLTGGITSISTESLEKVPATNIAQRLQGQVAGLSISNTNNKPGETSTMQIRSKKSLSGGNNPLIILDGIPFGGNMSEIDQNSVANISVLKDASSAAIYGSRATNGVILITSKKGKIGKPVVRYNGYVGFQQVERHFDLMDGPELIGLLKDYLKDTGKSNWDEPEKWLQTSNVQNWKDGKETDWIKETFKTALQQEHQISLSGATDATNYYASVSYTDQDGVVKYTGYKKYAVTLNLNQKIGEWLNVGINTQLSERDRGGVAPTFAYAYRMSPYADIKDENGKYLKYPMLNEVLYYSPFSNQDGVYDDKSRGAYVNGFTEVKLPLKGLVYRANLGYSYRNRARGSYYGRTTRTGEPLKGSATVNNDQWSDWTWENILRYDKNIGKHHVDATALYSAEKKWNSEAQMTGEDFLSDHNEYHNMSSARKNQTTKTDYIEESMASYMFRLNYSFDSRYMVTFTVRRDGASVFGKNNKWGTFPSVAAAWSISEEPFFQSLGLNKIDFLKLRLSYGTNGNNAIKAYETHTKMVLQNYIYGNEAEFAGGLVANFSAGNPNLKWETTKAFNVGLDFQLLKDRLTGSIDYYNTRTTDLLMSRTVGVMNGYTNMIDNVGKTKSQGFEVVLRSTNINNNDFQWTTSLALSASWSKIVALREDGKDDTGSKWFIGHPVSVQWDYKADGVWQQSEETEAAKYNAVPGDAKLLDYDNNGKIDADDRHVLGSKTPIWNVGLNNTFTYKNWSLSIFLNGIFDVLKENESVKFERQLFDKTLNYIRGIDYWKPGRESNEYTRLGYANKNHAFYTDASFLRIQDVNLAYRFPKSITDKIGLEGLSAYININNLYTFSKAYKYTTNLEQDRFSLDATGYPSVRTFTLGVNVTF